MQSQQFLWISVIVTVLLAIIFLYPRSKAESSRLNMFGGQRKKNLPDVGGTVSREARQASSEGDRVKSLNVMFNYNGHAWDAHEVLGIPAGAPMDMVKSAYQKSLSSTDSSAHDFINTAYNAICNEFKNHSFD